MKIMTSGAALAVIAMSIGAVPPLASPAGAYENPNGGQHFDKGCRPRPECEKKTTKVKKGETPTENAAQPSADNKSGTIPPNSPAAAQKQLCGVPYTPPCRADASAAPVETGQIRDKGKPPAAKKN